MVKSACSVGDMGSIPGSRRSLGEGNGIPLQYSGLENPMDGGAWPATVYRLYEQELKSKNRGDLRRNKNLHNAPFYIVRD